MFKIVKKQPLNPTVTKMVIEAPLIARKAHARAVHHSARQRGRRAHSADIAGYDREAGTVDIIFQIVGGTTMELNALNRGRLPARFRRPPRQGHAH